MKSSGLRKAIIGFTTALFVLGLIVLYLVFFVEDRREERIERNFRILNTISENVQQLAQKLPLNAANAISQRESLNRKEEGNSASALLQCTGTNQAVNGNSDSVGSAAMHDSISPASFNAELIKGQKVFEYKLPEEDQSAGEKVLSGLAREGFLFNFEGYWFLKPYKEFFPPLFRADAFDHYLVVVPSGEVLFHSRGMNLLKFKPAQLSIDDTDSSHGTAGSSYSTARISGKEYKVFTNPMRVFDQELQLVGLSSKESFNRATIYISSFYLILISLVFVLLLLSYPFLKLFFISVNERLKIWDLVYAIAALFMGTALSSLLVLDILQYRHYQETTIPTGLDQVALSVKSKFTNELNQILEQLYQFNQMFDEISAQFNHKVPDIYMKEDTARASLTPETDYQPWLQQFEQAKYQNFLNVAWICKDGMQTVKWTRDPQNTRRVKVAGREYFKGVIDHSYWFHQKRPFVMESISSLNDGKYYASISIDTENPDLPVATMTTRLRSLHSPVLSLGYGFALIDQAGKVWFHSTPQKNLQENLLEELSDDRKLRSYLISRSKGNFSSSYHGEEYQLNVLPLETWPLYLVTYYDKSYLNTANAEILSFSLISLAVYCLPCLLIITFLLLYRSSKGKLQFRHYHLNWLMPHPAQSGHYLRSIFYLLGLMLLYFVFFWSCYGDSPDDKLSLLFMVYSLPIFALGGSYLMLQSDFMFHRRRQLVIWFFGLSLLFILLLAFMHASLYWVGRFLLAALALLHGIHLISKDRFQRWDHGQHFRLTYRAMVVIGMLTLSLPLIYSSFKIGHDTEFLLYNRLVQLDLAEKLNQSLDKGLSSHSRVIAGEEVALCDFPSIHLSPQIDARVQISNLDTVEPSHTEAAELSPFMKIYSKIRPLYSDPVIHSLYLNEESGLDGRWSWNSSDELGLHFSFFSSFRQQKKLQLAKFILNSSLPVYLFPIPGDKYFLLLMLLVIVLLILLYRSVRFLYHRIFMGETYDIQWLVNIEELLFKGNGKLTPDLCEQMIFFIGLPKSGKTGYLARLIKKHGVKIQVHDLASIENNLPIHLHRETELIIFDHFEFGLHLKAITDKKLALLEDILRQRQAGIILVSSIHPLDFYREIRLNQAGEGEETHTDIQRWVRLLGNFQKLYAQSSNLHYGVSEYSGLPESENLELKQLVSLECESLPYLEKLKPAILRSLKKAELPGDKKAELPGGKKAEPICLINRDELILKIQSIAGFYYTSLWRNCTEEEKYLLYDLAQDGLINTRNSRVINSLINKGLVVNHRLLKVVNLSFRNFILANIAPEEALAIEKSISKASTWRQIRIPLIVVLLILAAFLFYTQKDVLDNIIGMLTAIGGTVLAILRLSSSLGSSSAASKNAEKA